MKWESDFPTPCRCDECLRFRMDHRLTQFTWVLLVAEFVMLLYVTFFWQS